jgi:hypothetical protein
MRGFVDFIIKSLITVPPPREGLFNNYFSKFKSFFRDATQICENATRNYRTMGIGHYKFTTKKPQALHIDYQKVMRTTVTTASREISRVC